MKPPTPQAGRRALTTLELLLAVALGVVVLGLLAPVVQHGVSAARSASCLGNQRTIGVALLGYAADHEHWLPPCLQGSRFWYQAIAPYLPLQSAAYRCPDHKPTAPDWLSYGYNAKFGLLDANGNRTVVSDPGMYERHHLLRFIDRSRTTMLLDLKHAQGTPNFNGGKGPVFYYDGKREVDYRHLGGVNLLWVDGRATHASEAAVRAMGNTEWTGAKNYRP